MSKHCTLMNCGKIRDRTAMCTLLIIFPSIQATKAFKSIVNVSSVSDLAEDNGEMLIGCLKEM